MAVVFSGTRGMIRCIRRRNYARWKKKVTAGPRVSGASEASSREKCAKVGGEVGVPSIVHVDNRAFETRASALPGVIVRWEKDGMIRETRLPDRDGIKGDRR